MLNSFLLALAIASASFSLPAAEENVTVTKARLKELERKEAELERLKNSASVPGSPTTNVATSQPAPAAPVPPTDQAATQPTPAVPVPSLDTLPGLQPGEVVDAGVLAAHFKQDPAAAAKRYAKQELTITGVISAFDKPLLPRNYKVLLRPPGRELPVICDFYPPEKYRAVFTANNGTTLVATLQNEAQITLARVGQTVTIKGECRGASRNAVKLVGCQFQFFDK